MFFHGRSQNDIFIDVKLHQQHKNIFIEGWSNNESARGRGRPHMTWIRVIQTDMRMLDLHESMTDDRTKWREMIHVDDTY